MFADGLLADEQPAGDPRRITPSATGWSRSARRRGWRLTVYLYRDDTTSDRDLLDVDWDDPDLVILEPSQPLSFPCRYLGLRRDSGRPEWPDYLAPHFHVTVTDHAVNYGCLLVQHAERWWAFTFGQGYRWVREEMVEPDFGLLVTSNRVADDQLRRVDSRTTSGILRQRATRVAVPAGIDAFDVDTAAKWIRSLSGTAADMPGLGQMTSATAARFNINRTIQPLAELGSVLDYLLDRFPGSAALSVWRTLCCWTPQRAEVSPEGLADSCSEVHGYRRCLARTRAPS